MLNINISTMDYKVMLWRGCGYCLDEFIANDATCEEDALDIVVKHLIDNNLTDYYMTVEEYDAYLEEEGIDDEEDYEDSYWYVDATMIGASYPIYLNIENMQIIKL